MTAAAERVDYIRTYTRLGFCEGGPMNGIRHDEMTDSFRVDGHRGRYIWQRESSIWLWVSNEGKK